MCVSYTRNSLTGRPTHLGAADGVVGGARSSCSCSGSGGRTSGSGDWIAGMVFAVDAVAVVAAQHALPKAVSGTANDDGVAG